MSLSLVRFRLGRDSKFDRESVSRKLQHYVLFPGRKTILKHQRPPLDGGLLKSDLHHPITESIGKTIRLTSSIETEREYGVRSSSFPAKKKRLKH